MSTSPNVRALVFDFGGVISKTLFETHAATEQALDLAPGTLQWRGPFAPETDPLWQDMQADRISERDYWLQRSAQVGRLLGENWSDMQTLVERARGADPDAIVRPEVRQVITEAKQAGLRLALLSNELDMFYGTQLRQRMPLLREFEIIVDATYTAILKPDPRAYQLCLAQLQLAPAQCLMIDDQKRNITGARALGMPCVEFQVTAPLASCEEIRGYFPQVAGA
jgi:putative hydrolase of the HAD superfamily